MAVMILSLFFMVFSLYYQNIPIEHHTLLGQIYTFKCLFVVTRLPRNPMPTPNSNATGTNTRNTCPTGRKFSILLKNTNISNNTAVYEVQ